MITTAVPAVPRTVTDNRRQELLNLHQELAQLTDLPTPVIQAFSEAPVIALDPRHGAWIVVPAERDPLRNRRSHHRIPAQPRRELQRVAESGVRFDRIVIAHELDPRGPVAEIVPLLADGPHTCTDEVARRLVGPLPAHPRTSRAVALLDAIAQGTTSLAAGFAAVAESLARDPIVFGVLGHPEPVDHGRPALWYPLTAWTW